MSDQDVEASEIQEHVASAAAAVPKTSKNPKKRKKHERTIVEKDTFKCKLCNFKTGYIGMYLRHMKKHETALNKYIYIGHYHY